LAIVTNEGRVAVDAAASGACRGRRAGLIVRERAQRADDRRRFPDEPKCEAGVPGEALRAKPGGGCVRQNRVVPAPVAGVKPAEERRPNRVRTILQSAGDGGKKELVSGESSA